MSRDRHGLLAGAIAAPGTSAEARCARTNIGLPRTSNKIGRYVDALDALMTNNPHGDSFVNRTHWF
jgi:hypothetical protein